jgi:hypothetical protein
MRKLGFYFVFLATSSFTVSAFADNHAVEVSIFGVGPPVDNAAYQTVRQVLGFAVAKGVVDRFLVSTYGIEGGFSACAEAAAPFGQVKSIDPLMRRLRSIRPNPETTAYSVKAVANCPSEAVVCITDAKMCPDGSFVPRVSPSCDFAPCPGE